MASTTEAAAAKRDSAASEAFWRDGCAVVPGFASAQEVEGMKEQALKLVAAWDGKTTTEFRTDAGQADAQGSDDYFISSAREVRCFWESGSDKAVVKDDPKATMRKVNKIGHGLHVLDPVFRAYAESDKVCKLVRELGWEAPVLPQSMYILKNPKIGGEVTAHQDSTFLYTEPRPTCLGLWLALDDATLENGALWFRPGSHKEPVRRHFQRLVSEDGSTRMVFEKLVGDDAMTPFEGVALEDIGQETHQKLRDAGFVSVECKAGDLVLIHGQVEHLSLRNESDKQRHTFQLHLIEGPDKGITWSAKNWLQYPQGQLFPSL
ncbi:Phytanoyl-CoA dioxygenase domain-containing protein 1 [Hondaea fermentalgiana]|uniref:Phytanoyl-CoA dioxygenase domain-containing protein 1 n=1 Tax=Hondaea fermentalgiana TaxID=2315210 RepID=A0A2R5GKX0_9STRA|nr:Phytanoyl-CoA dioxygenase domain-containing protein 1 [Hondaea fermentalgiana]|eukprot:GBG31552.1 Phytanoyl-CoA dioxygenase domain-containing protein 1 [Hondaea fermentalgiana]